MSLDFPPRWFLWYALLGLSTCADYPSPAQPHTLDYLEFHDPGGWVLRIDGDGGGRLKCRAFPSKSVHFSPATFDLIVLPDHFLDCSREQQFISPRCMRAVYFFAEENATDICYCPKEPWVKTYFRRAFRELRSTPGKDRNRRLIKRQWIQNPPLENEEWAAKVTY